MNDKKSVFKEDSAFSSGVGLIHEESDDVFQQNADYSDKKNVITTDTDCGTSIDASSAQYKQDAPKEPGSPLGEDFSLRLESSDEETFKDAIDTSEGASKGIETDVKSAISKKSDTLFSDIESSDDSIVYEPKSKSAVPPGTVGQSGEKASPTIAMPASVCEEEKVIESEFDPVESDEEFFEDLPLPEKTAQLSQETISDKSMQEEEERSSTPLIDEENDKSTELDLQSEAVSMDLIVKSSVAIPDQIMQNSTEQTNKDNVTTTTSEIATSQDFANDKTTKVDDKDSSFESMLIPDVIENTTVLSSSSLLLEEKEECSSTKPETLETDSITSEIITETKEISFDSLKVSSSIRTTDEKSENLVEALSTDLGSSENSKKVQEVPLGSENTPMSSKILQDDQETMETDVEIPEEGNFDSLESSKKIQELAKDNESISMSPTLIENENISPSVQLETMETDVETTQELNQDVDDKMEEDLSKLELSDSIVSENDKVEVEESMEIDETIFEVSGVSDLETIEDDTTLEKLDNQCLNQNESKEAQLEIVEEQEIDLKSNETPEKNIDIPTVVEKISDTDEKIRNNQEIESPEIDDKLSKLEQSQQKPMESAESTASQDFLDMEKTEKSNKAENSINEENTNKAEDLNEAAPLCDSNEQLLMIESEESAEKENPDDVIKTIELKKPDEVVKCQKEISDETGKLLNDHTSNKDITKCNKIPLEHIEKSPTTPEKCLKDQLKDDTHTTAEMQNTDIDETPLKVIDQTTEKTTKEVAELIEKKESPKEIAESTEKSDASVADSTAKIKSPQKLEETSQESNKELSEKDEFSEEILSSIEESRKNKESLPGTKLETSSEQSSEQTNQQNAEKEESIIETVVLVDESDVCEKDSMETSESLQKKEETPEESNKQEKDIEESPQPIVDQIEKLSEPGTDTKEMPKSLQESAVSHGTNSIEKSASLEETALSQKAESIEKLDSPKEATVFQNTASLEEIAVSQETDSIKTPSSPYEITVSEKTADSKKSEEIESIKSSEVISSNKESLETPSEVTTEVAVEKVATSVEITKSNKINDAKVDPDIIEIDDDDDLEEEKKLEDNSKKDEKASCSTTSEKELQQKNIDDVTKTSENKETKEIDTPMDTDAEITTEKPAQKPPAEDQTTSRDAKTDQGSSVKDGDVTMKGIPVPVLDDDDEPLLMIDTSHKEDNDTESNFMDNETATSAPTTDSSSDGSLEVFYDKECVNYECKRTSKNFYRAAVFALNYFKVSKKRSKTQFVCEDCCDRSLSSYEDLCKTLKMKQPLLHGATFKCQEFVEIIDSSDEDESDTGGDKVKVSDENALPKESIEMLEAELEGAIRKVMHNVDIQKQLSWTKQILQQRLTNLQEDSDFVTDQLRALQRKADHMHNSLYQCPKIKLRQLTPLDLNSGRMYNPESDNSASIPLPGDIIRNPICVNEQYYAVKTKAIASWVPCKVIEEVEGYQAGYNTTKTYKIKFTKLAKYPMFKTVYAKHMAYYDPPNVRLPIGSRVIAYFDATSLSRGKEKMLIPSAFYPGIIAEPLKQSNKFRYLVFYDDGYFQYVNHKDVRLVCQASENVWEDVHHQSREFIHNYLTQYAVNRPMVQTQKGQSMLVDYNGKWIYARVIDVDCSLVQMLFEGQSRSEWIYRGSTRLGPVYKESNNLSQKNTLNATRRRTEPFIRYINGDDSSSSQQVQETETPPTKTGTGEIRSVAKKSVSRVDTSNNNSTTSSASQPVPTVRHLNNSTIFVDDDNKPKGKVVYYTARKNLPPRNYVPHICNPSCPFNITHNLSFYSPLAKPLLSGWERQVFRQKSKKFIVYRGPCGKRMRNIEELHRYLRVTDNELNVDNFDFSPDTNCLAEYVLEKCLVNKKDISCGKEKMPIPCVNYYDETMPPACEYSAVRIPTEGVPLNLDEEFMCGCDCEDDCSDKTKCACWQLTYAGAKYGMPTVPTEMVGYQYKRLYEHVPTGIYECNSRCKCKANCVNRVVQQPLQSKLQVFKTSNRGWGLRCINDVPRGSFICVYAGQMLTEQVANEGGLDAGDEYFAELDYIEVAEQIKEGYESDVQEPEEDEDLYNLERDDDDVDFRAPGESFKDKEFNTRLRTRKGNKNSTDGEFDSQERQVISFEPNKNMDTSNEPNEKPTIRKLFGKDESCYVMDAKVRGNLGRYFNHSCSPNLFVQNVFVDTHDLRFPWVAFFASTHIRAGTELTWNYNYEVGVVPGKVLYCQCGAPNCRQRLL